MFKRQIVLTASMLLFSSSFLISCAQANNNQTESEKKPNIVLLFSDDAGFADFGFQGSDIMKTPNLDKLAARGIKFTQAYVSDSTCGPSRAGLLTGRYQQRFGYEENNVPGYMSAVSAIDGEHMGLPLSETTMGDYMKSQGYATAFFGKWHLGGTDEMHPMNRGFDTFYGFRGGDRSYFAYPENDPARKQVQTFFDKKLEQGIGNFKEHDGYLTDVLAEQANKFIGENQHKPFFVFLSFTAVHTPIQALPEDLAKFPQLSGIRQQVAAMTLSLDRASGLVIDKLKELGLDDNTIIVYTNDNGGPTDKNASSNWPLSGTKSNHLEGGIRVPFIISWPGKLPEGEVYENPVSTLDLLPTFYEVAGGAEYKKPVDGVNLIPFLNGEEAGSPHETLYWKKESRAAIRHNDFKLIRFPDRPAELYNLSDDISELENLAAQNPELVKKLFKQLFAWELELERPLWMLKREFEKYDLDRMDKYRLTKENISKVRSEN